MEGARTISRNIFKDSEGKFYIEEQECQRLKDQCFFARYPGIRRWHDWVARELKRSSCLVAASGQVRQFFGHPDEILTNAVAHEPQANTTYALNLALLRLWNDPENEGDSYQLYTGAGRWQLSLRIIPLHLIHDALVGEWPKADREWAKQRVRGYFDNPITIAGQRLVIPYDGAFGPSWGNLTEGKL